MSGAKNADGTALREREWQKLLTELAAVYGWESMHVRPAMGSKKHGWVTPTSVSGWPDMVLWHEKHRKLIFAELKTDRGRLNDDQRVVLASLARAGQAVCVWRPRDFDQIHEVLANKVSPVVSLDGAA